MISMMRMVQLMLFRVKCNETIFSLQGRNSPENVFDAGNIDAGVDVGTTVAEVTVSIEFRL